MASNKKDIDLFIHEYIKTRNGKQSAILAGYSPKTADQQASRLLKSVKVAEAIRKRQSEMAEKFSINEERVLNEWARVAFGVSVDLIYLDENGEYQFKDVTGLDDDQKALISEVNTIKTTSKDGDTTTTVKVKTYDKLKALEALSRYLGLFEKDNNQKSVIKVIVDEED